jgi:hypothetical protein
MRFLRNGLAQTKPSPKSGSNRTIKEQNRLRAVTVLNAANVMGSAGFANGPPGF